MKKILLIAVILCTILGTGVYFACTAYALNGKSLKGSGNLVSRTIDAPAFTAIDAARAVNVVISDKLTNKITIEADDNLIDFVVVKADGDELDITMDKKINSISNSHVTVTVPANGCIRSLDASSAASITTTKALKADEFSIDASSAAKISVAVKANKCEIDASSAAKITAAVETSSCEIDASSASKIEVTGTADVCRVEMSSAAKLDAGSFVVKAYTISVSSGSHANVNCTGSLNASASSGASVGYKGDCTTDISRSSGGNVHQN